MDYLDLAMRIGTGALGGAAATFVLAPFVSQRQELGKARGSDLDALQRYIAQQRSYVLFHWHGYGNHRVHVSDSFSPSHIDAMVVRLVRLSVRQARRRQRRIRACLVRLVGEVIVQAAAEVAMVQTTTKDGGDGTPVRIQGQWSAAVSAAAKSLEDEGIEEIMEGSYHAFAKDRESEVKMRKVLTDLDELQRAVGGAPGLAGGKRRRRKARG